MERLAKLSGLSRAKKDHLVHSLWSIVGGLRQEVSGLREQAHRLEIEKTSLQAQAAKKRSNSSKPPALEGLGKTRSLRRRGERPVGGVPGHKGSMLERSETPEHIVEHLPLPQCEACGTRGISGPPSFRSVSTGAGGHRTPCLASPLWLWSSTARGIPRRGTGSSAVRSPFQGRRGLPH